MPHYPLNQQEIIIGYVKAKTIVGKMEFGNIADSIVRLKFAKKQQKIAENSNNGIDLLQWQRPALRHEVSHENPPKP